MSAFLRFQNPQTPAANIVVNLLTDNPDLSLEEAGRLIETGPPELWDGVTRTMVRQEAVAKALKAIVPAPVLPWTDILVYHATDDDTAEQLLSRGFLPETKPRRREGFDYAPGRGLDEGLYVGATATSVESYGRVILSIDVPKSVLRIPQELAQLGETNVLRALHSHDGAVIRTRIPANQFRRVR